MDSLGIYISVPFCKAKCTFCNFASDAFAPVRMEGYVARLCREIEDSRQQAHSLGATLPERVDTVYFGGGTPSLLEAAHMTRIFDALRGQFHIDAEAEITLECAPGQLAEATLAELQRQGLNRVSLGVQSFVDAEAAAVGRLHTRAICLEELARLRAAGVLDIGVDLIAGLPGQTEESWRYSLEQTITAAMPHVSVYMLEIDEESRLGREALAGGNRYGAGTLPTDDAVAEWYGIACEMLESSGVMQYEISNFARTGFRSRHNVKYWKREPYLGFGLDAHSMLRIGGGAVRFRNGDDLGAYMADGQFAQIASPSERIGVEAAFEEALFLGLRMNEGVSLGALRTEFGDELVAGVMKSLAELLEGGMMEESEDVVCLTAEGRLLSNEVFERVLVTV